METIDLAKDPYYMRNHLGQVSPELQQCLAVLQGAWSVEPLQLSGLSGSWPAAISQLSCGYLAAALAVLQLLSCSCSGHLAAG
jgi:hypothetical protein